MGLSEHTRSRAVPREVTFSARISPLSTAHNRQLPGGSGPEGGRQGPTMQWPVVAAGSHGAHPDVVRRSREPLALIDSPEWTASKTRN